MYTEESIEIFLKEQGRLYDEPVAETVEEAEEFTKRYPGQWGSRMTITRKDGTTIQKQVDDMSGSEKNPLSEKQETDKFTGLAGTVYRDERRERLMETILSLETCSRLPGIFGEGRL